MRGMVHVKLTLTILKLTTQNTRGAHCRMLLAITTSMATVVKSIQPLLLFSDRLILGSASQNDNNKT